MDTLEGELKMKNNISITSIKPNKFIHERMIDWFESGTHIQQLLRAYNKQYRKKICSKCPLEQQKKRYCLKLDMYSTEGIQLKHCSHMDKARSKKYKKKIMQHMGFHPMINR